jgi:hypothetical protein
MNHVHQHMSEATKHVVDGLSALTVLGTLAQVLPPLAALFTIVWTSIRIYETKTIQSWVNNKGRKRSNSK